jgi:hypothetical protein
MKNGFDRESNPRPHEVTGADVNFEHRSYHCATLMLSLFSCGDLLQWLCNSRTCILLRTALGLTNAGLNWVVSWLQRSNWIEITNLALKRVILLGEVSAKGGSTVKPHWVAWIAYWWFWRLFTFRKKTGHYSDINHKYCQKNNNLDFNNALVSK